MYLTDKAMLLFNHEGARSSDSQRDTKKSLFKSNILPILF